MLHTSLKVPLSMSDLSRRFPAFPDVFVTIAVKHPFGPAALLGPRNGAAPGPSDVPAPWQCTGCQLHHTVPVYSTCAKNI